MIDLELLGAFLDDRHRALAEDLEPVAERIAALPAEHEDEAARRQARELVQLLGEARLPRLAVPAEYGGDAANVERPDLRGCCLTRDVLAAASPDEALTLAREHRGPIDLLLTDVIMPGMNGRQLTEGVEEFRPGLPTLYMSGYAADIIADHGVIADGVNLVRKPFSVKDLSRRVREVLDAPTDS